jgi:hypothetical protein
MRFFLLFATPFLVLSTLTAQPKVLKREDGLGFDSKNSVTKASIQAETEKKASIQIEFKGFDEKNKSYKITATVLNQVKKPMKEFEPVTVDLDPKSGVADFGFTFTQKTGIAYAATGVESKFIEFVGAEKNASAALPGADFLNIGARKFVFQFRKNWRVKVPVTVQVKLVPYKSAASIKL